MRFLMVYSSPLHRSCNLGFRLSLSGTPSHVGDAGWHWYNFLVVQTSFAAFRTVSQKTSVGDFHDTLVSDCSAREHTRLYFRHRFSLIEQLAFRADGHRCVVQFRR